MLYIDIRPLMDGAFTGIPQLTWHLARYWLARSDAGARFFIGKVESERPTVEQLVEQRTGRYFRALRRAHYRAMRPTPSSEAKQGIALYPHTRATREKIFGREVQIIHDLTAILTPEFHPEELSVWESRRFLHDLPDFDHFVCVSEASRNDLVRYFGINQTCTSVAYPGVDWFESHFSVYGAIAQAAFEPYVLLFG